MRDLFSDLDDAQGPQADLFAEPPMLLADEPLTSQSLLVTLKAWAEAGWLRRLDSAFARFAGELQADAPPPVLMAAALVAHMEGRGHACLLLGDLAHDAHALLGWPPEAAQALQEVMHGLPQQVSGWLAALRESPLVQLDDGLGLDDEAGEHRPLLLRGDKLYLRRYWGYEHRIARQVLSRGLSPTPPDAARVRRELDRLFPSTDEFDWQKMACAIALRGRLSIVTGGPGTGKTYTAARLLALLFAVDESPERLRVSLAAPTGKAAARLKQSIDTALAELQAGHAPQGERPRIAAARTLHSLLGARPDTRRFRYDAAHPLDIDVLIVDEASMVHLEMMSALLEALPPQARVIFLGDKDQLASVEAGAVLGDLCSHAEAGLYDAGTAAYVASVTGQTIPAHHLGDGPPLAQQTVMLRRSRRFEGAIGQLALAVNRGDVAASSAWMTGSDSDVLRIDAASADSAVQLALHGRPGAPGGFGSYLDVLAAGPAQADASGEAHHAWVVAVLTAFDRFRLLCAVREGEWGAAGLNQAVERALVAAGRLHRRGEWYEGRPVMVTRNDAGVGVFNGDIGIVLRSKAPGAPLRAWFLDGATARSVSVSRLAHVDTAFAMTVHKSQGSEFEHTVLVLPREPSRVLTRELVYTGITRARKAFTLVSGRAPAFADALQHRTRRASGLLELLSPTGLPDVRS